MFLLSAVVLVCQAQSATSPVKPIPTPPAPIHVKPRFELDAPLPTVPGVMIDSYANGAGFAQQLARSYSLQGRIMWVDGTANIERVNTEAKIVQLVHELRDVGFNTIVFDVKPISGQVLYKSAIAPKIQEWKGRLLPLDFDPLAVMAREAKSANLNLYVSLNAFSEGHKLFGAGPGFAKKDWQSICYEPKPFVQLDDGDKFPLSVTMGKIQTGMVTVFSSAADIPKTELDSVGVLVGPDGRMENMFDSSVLGLGLSPLPKNSYVLYGTGEAATYLRHNYKVQADAHYDTDAEFVLSSDPRETQYPLMMNPNNLDLQRYEMSIAQEVLRNYPIDGIIYDDRLRYEGINADFSDLSRELFEHRVGKKLTWPDDVFKYTYSRTLQKGIQPGPYYDAWMTWRAEVLHEYLEKVRHAVKEAKPTAQLGLYVGSWYGDYPALGNNYASTQTQAGFWFSTPGYAKAGNSGLLDFLISGCYYPTPTIYDAMGRGIGIGYSIEGAGMLTNRLVRDECWTYAGIDPDDYKDNPVGLTNALQAACASTQGVMVFDLSHGVESLWPVFAKAFSQYRRPPHRSSQALANVRRQRFLKDKAGKADPPIIIAAGSTGIGQ